MKRSEVRTFIQSGVAAINDPTVGFNTGLISDFDASSVNAQFPQVLFETQPKVGPGVNVLDSGLSVDSWPIVIRIFFIDKLASSPEEYEPLVDAADEIAQKLTYQYNRIITGYKLVKLNTIKRDPFIKDHAACLTGVILSFTIEAPDQTAICQPGDL